MGELPDKRRKKIVVEVKVSKALKGAGARSADVQDQSSMFQVHYKHLLFVSDPILNHFVQLQCHPYYNPLSLFFHPQPCIIL